MNVDQNLLKLSWQLFDKNGTGMITPEEVGMFSFNPIFLTLPHLHLTAIFPDPISPCPRVQKSSIPSSPLSITYNRFYKSPSETNSINSFLILPHLCNESNAPKI
jgi:hypothetical protein